VGDGGDGGFQYTPQEKLLIWGFVGLNVLGKVLPIQFEMLFCSDRSVRNGICFVVWLAWQHAELTDGDVRWLLVSEFCFLCHTNYG
jgi:hypothetical protein